MRLAYPALLATLSVTLMPRVSGAEVPSVTLPATMTVTPGTTVNLSMVLTTPAPGGGVTVTFSSSNPAVVGVWPPSLIVPMEMTGPPRLVPTITGHLAGTATISAAAPGYTTAAMQVQVGGGNPGAESVSLTPTSLAITGTATQNLTLLLSAAAPAGGVSVSLSSGNPSVATVPAAVTVASGLTTATVPVTGVAPGSTTITASTAGFGTATASVTVSAGGGGGGGGSALPGIIVPASLTLAPGSIKELPIELSAAAPPNGVYVTVTSSDTSKVTLSQSSIYIPDGMTSVPRKVTTVNAMSPGAASIDVSAPGYASAGTQVQVTGSTPTPGGGTMSFSPGSLSITGSETKSLLLSLSSPASAGGLAVNLSSSQPSVAGVPSVINIPGGTATYSVQVTGAGPGTTAITATAPNYGSAAANVTVSSVAPPPPPPSTQAAIVLPASVELFPGDSPLFAVALPSAAGAGGVPITLTSSDPTKVSVSPSSFVIPEGATTARRVEARVTGLAVGSATVTAAAAGYGSGNSQVQVKSAAPGGTMTLSPAALTLLSGSSQNLTLTLSGALPPNGLIVYLNSSNTSAATAPASVTVPAKGTTTVIPVTGAGTGTSTITATAANFGTAASLVTVSAMPQINLPANVSPAVGETVNFPVTLSTAAPSDAVISLQSSDVSKLTVAPSSFTILKGAMSAPGVTATVSGAGAGTATVTASSPGYTAVSRQVVVTSAPSAALTMGLSPANLSIAGLITQNLTLTLSGPAPPGGVTVTVASANGSIATVPSTFTIPASTTSIAVPVTALAVGSTVITASSNGMQNATATVTVTPAGNGTLTMPASWMAAPNQSNTLQVILNPGAPAGGVTLTFASSDTSKVTVTPATVTVASGETKANVQINGVAAGAANVSVSAPGYTGAGTPVQVSVATGSGVFIPGVVAINTGITDTVSLSLGPQSPAGLTATLVSSDPSVASVPATVVVPANSYNVSVPVKALTAGSTIVTATVPGFGTSTLRVTVLSMDGVSVEWHGACWVPVVYQGVTYWRHAMDFKLTTPQPVTLQASLFYTSADCTGQVDNMNDFDSTTSSTHMIQGFVNYPYPVWKPTSALFWIGARTADGKCPPGSLCSGCLAYTASTPFCDTMP